MLPASSVSFGDSRDDHARSAVRAPEHRRPTGPGSQRPPARAHSARRPGHWHSPPARAGSATGGGHDVKVSGETSDVAPEPQAVLAPLTAAAIFLVVVMGPSDASTARVRGVCADVPALIRSVGFRDAEGLLTCVVGLGSQAWDRLGGRPRPAGLHPFREIRAGIASCGRNVRRPALPHPGSSLRPVLRARRAAARSTWWTRAGRRRGSRVQVFDERDLLGFVDGTENPTGAAAVEAIVIGDEDRGSPAEVTSSSRSTSTTLPAGTPSSAEEQERTIGRTEAVRHRDGGRSVKPSNSHVALNTVVDENGEEQKILRYNMPFGAVGRRRVRYIFHRLRQIALIPSKRC